MEAPPPFGADVERLAAQLTRALDAPVSTYRVQLSSRFGFAALAALVPYLDALGVGACYLSPCLKARPGSLHGYDVVDHRELNPELGTRAELEALARDLRSRGMGVLLDTVPNHMAVDPVHNLHWRDVLENGPGAESAEWFDIDWSPAKEALHDRVLLPILGDQYGVVLERGELQVSLDRGALVMRYFDHVLPTDPQSLPAAFQPEIDTLRIDQELDERELGELLSVMSAFQNLPASIERDPARSEERRRESRVSHERFDTLLEKSPRVRAAIEGGLTRLNGSPGVAASFDALHALLERQPYRVAYWRTAFDEINYRRFFDINELAAIRMEEPRVFDEAHRLILELVRDGLVTGLRLDHPDGLYDPEEYFERLQSAAWRAYATALADDDRPDLVDALVEWRAWQRRRDPAHPALKPLYLAAEKILSAGETFRTRWAIHGGTGYWFLNLINGLFVDRAGLHQLERVWARLSGQHEGFSEIAYESRRLIAQTAMASEMNLLSHALEAIAARDRRSRDFTLNSLRRVLREVVSSFPVYRTYVSVRGLTGDDRDAIARAIAEARRRSPVMESSIFDFIQQVLTASGTGAQKPDGAGEGAREEEALAHLRFAMKFQQITSPVQAKGTEDTAFYRYRPLVAINEVGSDPSAPSVTVDQFHADNARRLTVWPVSMLTLATHDTKLGADARARLTVVSERAQEWRQAVSEWMRLNARHRVRVNGTRAPDRADEYLFYQALLAIWPPQHETDPLPASVPEGLAERIAEYMIKAVREAKIRSSWLRADHAYEDAVTTYVQAVLGGPGAGRFLASFVPFARTIARLGAATSLAQHVLMAGAPGVPDIYQGAELWHLCLVDPDNRHPVDFEARRSLLASFDADLDSAAAGSAPSAEQALPRVHDLAANWIDGGIKLWVTAATLRHRRRDADLFLRGEYIPLAPSGETPVVAFARRHGARALIVVASHHASRLAVPRGWPVGPAWGDRTLPIPPELRDRPWHDRLTGRTISPASDPSSGLPLSTVLDPLPVAWLVSGDPEAV